MFECLERTKGYLRENDRSVEAFGMHINVNDKTKPEEVPDLFLRWRDAGGTHASVVTMGKGMTTAQQHIDYAARMADALGKAGLMAR